MRKIFLYLTLLIATTIMASDIKTKDSDTTKSESVKIKWLKDYNAGVKEAKRYDKPMLFIVSNKSCPPCKRLAEYTLEDSRVIKALNKDFASVIAYVSFTDPSSSDFVPRELNTGVTPTLWFLIPNADVVFSPVKGPPSAEVFLDMIKQVKEKSDSSRKEKR